MRRSARLLDYLGSDPDNPALLAETLEVLLQESQLEVAAELIEQHAQLIATSPPMINLSGIIAMRSGDRARARSAFEGLRTDGHDHPGVRFNLAWLNALDGRFEEVGNLLDPAVLASVPRAAALKVQALHHVAAPEEALALGQELLELYPEDDGLLGAASVAAMDADDYQLAAELAGRAKGGADSLTTRGLIALNEDDTESALALFEQALVEQPQAPRAWLGRGLGLLVRGDTDQAAPALEKGAEIWGDHLGSWIAAGWAQFLRGDLAAARRNFDTAMSHDDNFAETHGALAVMDIADGNLENAKRRADVALRLDKECFGGMLARALLLEASGKPELARQIVERAMQVPAGVGGKTLAQALVGFGAKGAGRTVQ